MPEVRLEKVGDSATTATPSLTKVLGPVAWEAMAMATQQHYLVKISKSSKASPLATRRCLSATTTTNAGRSSTSTAPLA
jgi:hypothetical protein